MDHNSKKHFQVSVQIGDVPMVFEMGKVAKQASGAVWVRWGESVVLVTACASDQPREGIDFFPLTCEYIEKAYAAGRIPGGFFKRETKPRDAEILNARIIDRSLRPLFPEGFRNDVQIIATVMSHDGQHSTDVMALCGASMALHVSNLPFALSSGPIAGVRVGRIAGKLVANPTVAQMAQSDIDMMVASSQDAIVMVEGGAHQVSELDLIDALFFAQSEGMKVISACQEMRSEMGVPKLNLEAPQRKEELFARVEALASHEGLAQALQIHEKQNRYGRMDEIKATVLAAFSEEESSTVARYFSELKARLMRFSVLDTQTRIDGRRFDQIRPICAEVGILPRAHGSALFTRGETQAVVTATLGTQDDEQKTDTLLGEASKKFMLHYNFPPFSVGEARPLRGTSRREIGHGALAERAVEKMVEQGDDFPYTIRIVSEITESNGSSSMASVCGATLSMWDAGIKLKAPVAGIAMGLIQEGDRVAVLSDILGDEDHLGDMDFKICGTEHGVTAIQMDIKIDGLSKEVLTQALEQARQGRLHILAEMKKGLSQSRAELSVYAPRITTLRVHPDKIRDVIGPGGRVIRDIVARSGAKIEITDDGIVKIAAVGSESLRKAIRIIEDLTKEAEIGVVYRGLVKRIVDFGAFVELFPGTEGLCHVSELAENRVNQISDVLQEGDEVNIVVLSIDREGKIRLSRKRALGKEPGEKVSLS
ncbi:MAG: polyribonucleotide nucleotidyltransferase [Myxococcaceae bacterium]|nr:polyribonucleotide nucleotidyltransferase [Myxococcaceae bacterium]MBH2005918.1 polyribonucleotide nucleotidyltransferase [Myxococcaceae bacterium]